MAARRILMELKELEKEPLSIASAGPIGEDMLHWEGFIRGPENSPYEGGVFFITIDFPRDYPFNPPKIVFKTKICHPNIDSNGVISMDIFKERWNLTLTISMVLQLICLFMVEPDTELPLVPEIADMCKTDKVKYESTVRDWTQKYAMG